MGGFFGTISTKDCVNDLFYGTDYNSHLGTKRAGMVTQMRELDIGWAVGCLQQEFAIVVGHRLLFPIWR